jgi:hypothetical protein
MAANPKKTGLPYESFEVRPGKKQAKTGNFRFRSLLTNSHTLIPLLSGAVMILSGLTIVSITMLGLISSLWISVLISLLGCVSCMLGGFLIYQTVTSQGSFDGLINQAIRRVINSQN